MKPFAGILTDAFPLFGNRRKSYILISAVLAALSWLALIVTAHEYRYLLSVAIVINAFMVIASTAVGGYMVETAQATSGSGRLTAIRQFIQQACLVINGPAAGYLASIAFGWTAAACGAIMFLLVPITILFLRERRQGLDSREGLDNAKRQLVNIATARTMWAAAGLMALFYIAPRLRDGTLLQAAERTAPQHANTGLPGIDCRHLRHPRRCRLRNLVPPA